MTERIITDSNGRKHITNEPQLHPPQRTWVGLTEEERDYFTYIDTKDKARFRKYADYIEAKLKEKNNV